MSTKLIAVLVVVAALCWHGSAQAGCNVTHSFTTGTTAVAAQVNQNFADLSGCALPATQVAGNPTIAGTVNLPNLGRGIAVLGRYAYVLEQIAATGLEIYDVSNKTAPALVKTYATNANPLGNPVVSGRYIYIPENNANGVQIVDISNVSSPISVALINSGAARSVALSGGYLYVGSNSGGTFKVYDVSKPTAPVLAGSLTLANVTAVNGIALQGPYAFLAETPSASGTGLQIVDVSNPAGPTLVGTYAAQNAVSGVAVSGRYAYLAEQAASTGIEVVDISNPASPSLVATIPTVHAATATNVSPVLAGPYLYFPGTNITGNNFEIYDVSNPTAATQVGYVNPGTAVQGLSLVGKYAYVSGATPGKFVIVDITGAMLPAASIGSLSTNQLVVDGKALFDSDLYVNGGINAGFEGISSRGGLGVFVASPTAANPVAARLMGGNVGIGTTTPDTLLTVGSAIPSGNVARFQNSTGSCYINPTSTSLSCSSDERLKTAISPLRATDALRGVLALEPVSYNWTSEAADTRPHIGLIAQDVRKIFPDLVSQARDGYLTLNYAGLTPYLISAVQRQQLEIAELKATIRRLEAGNDTLRAELTDIKRLLGARVAVKTTK